MQHSAKLRLRIMANLNLRLHVSIIAKCEIVRKFKDWRQVTISEPAATFDHFDFDCIFIAETQDPV
jgi:hypothetical protein